MELWIRSQDRKSLKKVSDITTHFGNAKFGIYEEMIPIGYYETEKRALKILDEIQKIIKWCQTDMRNVTIGDVDNLIGSFEDYVYEMPKE